MWICPHVELTATLAWSAQARCNIIQLRPNFIKQRLKKIKLFVELLQPTMICRHKNKEIKLNFKPIIWDE